MAQNSTTWKKILKLVSAAAFAAVAGFAGLTAFTPTGVFAVSAYDDLLNGGEFSVQSGCGGSATCTTGLPVANYDEIYGDFQTILSNSTNSTCVAAHSFWLSNYTSPNFVQWASVQNLHYTQGYTHVGADEQQRIVYWSFATYSTPKNFTFTNSLGVTGLGANTGSFGRTTEYRITYTAGSPATTVSCFQVTTNTSHPVAQQNTNSDPHNDGRYYYQHLFMSGNYSLTMPAGYEGGGLNSSYEPPVPPNNAIPNVELRGFNNFKGQFADLNFSTFDEVPFTCEDGLAPVLRGELWNMEGTPTKLDDYEANSTGLFTIDLPRIEDDTNYKLISWYDCDDDVNVFPNNQHYEFTIDRFGQVVQSSLKDSCMSAEFPYMSFDDCMEAMFGVIELLVFRNPTFGGSDLVASGECKNLVMVDDWINLNNPQVCPAFSSTVRNVVTPIVLFMLGLGFVHVINRRDVVDG